MVGDDGPSDPTQFPARHPLAFDQVHVRRRLAQGNSGMAVVHGMNVRRRMVVRVHDDPDCPKRNNVAKIT